MQHRAQKVRLYNDVYFLTKLRPYRNYQNLESLEKVCVYLKEQFTKAGYAPHEQQWMAKGEKYKNILASYKPEKEKRLIIGAHYDVAGEQPGADDNASAVAGLLETARVVAENEPDLEYGIDFTAYCLEEPPFFATEKMGSYIHAESLHRQKVEVLGMICLEMIGFFSDEPGSQAFPSPELAELYPDTANFIIVVGVQQYRDFNTKVHQLMSSNSEIDVQVIHFPTKEGLAGMSDQRSYWKFGYPALMINDTSFVRNPNYHQKSDTIDTLDFDKIRAVVDGCSRAAMGIL